MAQRTVPSKGSTKPDVPDWDIPCLNCDRYGTIPGQMMTDAFNQTFCSPDCGWSYILRPGEEARAAKRAAAMAAQLPHAQQQRRARARRSSRTSSKQQPQAQANLDQTRKSNSKPIPVPEKEHSNKDDTAAPLPSSAQKPPSFPASYSSKSSKRVDLPRHVPRHYSSNAMFEYTMLTGQMDL